MYEYNVKVTRVVDGDTVDVDIDLGFGMIYKKQRVRLHGIDTPESRTRDLEEKKYGKAAKAHLKGLLSGKTRMVCHDKGKFGRILGEMFAEIDDEWVSVNQIMITDHHAVAYMGQSKEDIAEEHLINRTFIEV
jgi:micrococcal nuclease|tara:strand:+ start:2562 stop:2960 length:399 start_codon:yes stop_codon:yes gene_type:complete